MQNLLIKDLLAKLLASEDISVVHAPVTTASFDLKGRILTLPVWDKMSNDQYDMLIGHEVGHALDTPQKAWEYFVKKHAGQKQAAFHCCLNIVEDARIERNIQDRYPGLRPNFRNAYKELKKTLFKDLFEKNKKELSLADRVNLHFKLGKSGEIPNSELGIKFNKTEQNLVNRIDKVQKFFDVFKLGEELLALSKLEAQNKNENFDDGQGEEVEIEIEIDEEDIGDYLQGGCSQGSGQDNIKIKIKSKKKEGDQDDLFDEESDEGDGKGDGKGDGEGDEKSNSKETGGSGDQNDSNNQNGKKKIKVKICRQGGMTGLEGETQGLLDDFKEQHANTSSNVPGYAKLADVDWDAITIKASRFLKRNRNKTRSPNRDRWLRSQVDMINSMVSTFNRKKAARRYENRKQNKTGVLNMKKLHSYQLTDNVFKSIDSYNHAKKHCLLLFIDLSSSMDSNVRGAAKQLMTLINFCDKIKIPYRVYGFTTGSRYGISGSPVTTYETDYGTVIPSNDAIFYEFFNERMSFHEKNSMMDFLWSEWVTRNNTSISMGGTPLNDAVFRSTQELPQLMRATGSQIGHVVFLTDGGDCPNPGRIRKVPKFNYADRWIVIHNGKQYDYGPSRGTIKFYAEILKDTCKASITNFNISDYVQGEPIQEVSEDNLGWTKEYIIKLDILTNLADKQMKQFSDESTEEFRKRYSAFSSSKRKVQVILDKFVDTISKSL